MYTYIDIKSLEETFENVVPALSAAMEREDAMIEDFSVPV
jgi:hypothetical protein